MTINFKKIVVLSFLLTVNFYSLRILVNISCTSSGEEEFYRTNLTIDTAALDFTLLPNGRYTCTFDLNVKGNEYSSRRNSSGIFAIPDDSIIMTYLYFPEYPEEEIDWDPPISQNNSSTLIFQSNLSLLLGESTRLSGKFEGKCRFNTSDLYTYHLGIDWGGVIDQLFTTISLDASVMDLVDFNVPEHQIGDPENDTDGSMVGYTWDNKVCTGFNGTFLVYPKTKNPNLLVISSIDWNVSINQRIELQIRNIASFKLNIEISTPTWIDCNVTNFWLMINETRAILFVINSQATSGLVDTILIKIIGSHKIYPIDLIEIPVDIKANIKLFDIIFLLFSFSIIFVVIPILMYYQRSNINQFMNQIKKQIPTQYTSESEPIKTTLLYNNVSKSRGLSWNSIKNRWESILPKNELKVLEILCNFGNMNQQALANHLGVSKVTMSRLISRLESKRLIQRERLGMSKIIELNEEIL